MCQHRANPEMNAEIASLFCKSCNWAYETWLTCKCLYDQNDNEEKTLGKAVEFFNRLNHVVREYSLQQIAKLHDPAVTGNNFNVSINFVVQFGDWGDKQRDIQKVVAVLEDLGNYVNPARNKILAHNDLNTQLKNEPLGVFPEGEDDRYFKALQELVNEVHIRWVNGEGYVFNDLAQGDVAEFLRVLEASN